MGTTSLKMPEELKARAAAAAKLRGLSPHAFMLGAIRDATSATERRASFIADAKAAREEMLVTGRGYDADDLHKYLRAKAAGARARKPKARAWRG